MSKSSRRNFLLSSTSAIAGTFITPSLIKADSQIQKKPGVLDSFSQSGLVTGQKKPLSYQSILGFLSEEQIAPHFDAHYGSALKGYIAADDKL